MTNAPPLPNQAPAQTSGLAIGSMVCGILGFLTVGLSGIAAVILGHLGLSRIKKSNGALGGRGFAVTGLITGYLTALILPIAVIAGLVTPLILRAQEKAANAQMTANMKQMGVMCMEFEIEYGIFPSDASAAAVAADIGSAASRLSGPDVLNQLEGRGADIGTILSVSPAAEGDWIYFPGRQTSGSDPGLPVLVSPVVRGQAMVLRLDGSVVSVTEPERKRLWAAPDGVTIPARRR